MEVNLQLRELRAKAEADGWRIRAEHWNRIYDREKRVVVLGNVGRKLHRLTPQLAILGHVRSAIIEQRRTLSHDVVYGSMNTVLVDCCKEVAIVSERHVSFRMRAETRSRFFRGIGGSILVDS